MEPTPDEILTIEPENKIKSLLKSRKFWALVAALATIASGYFAGGVPVIDAVNQVVIALTAYTLATGIENSAIFSSK